MTRRGATTTEPAPVTVRSINDGPVELYPLAKLKDHPENANEGDDATTGESIDANGWYGAVIAQRDTGYILAGHTRVRQLRARDAKHVEVQWVKCDDATARRILAVDNRANRLGVDNPTAMLQLLSKINESGTLVGTGWSTEAFEDLAKMNAGPLGLDDMHKKYGTSEPSSLWPWVRVQLPPEAHERYLAILDRLGDAPEAERFAQSARHRGQARCRRDLSTPPRRGKRSTTRRGSSCRIGRPASSMSSRSSSRSMRSVVGCSATRVRSPRSRRRSRSTSPTTRRGSNGGASCSTRAEAVQLQAWDHLDRLHIVDTGVTRPLAVASYWWPPA